MIEDPRVKKINFTGSTIGRTIAELVGRNLKPVLLELGGKAPAVVWKDVDLELAVKSAQGERFFTEGKFIWLQSEF